MINIENISSTKNFVENLEECVGKTRQEMKAYLYLFNKVTRNYD